MTKKLQLLALFLSVLFVAYGNNFYNSDNESITVTEKLDEAIAELEDIIENQQGDEDTQAQLNETILTTQIKVIIPPRPPCPVNYTTAARRDRAQGTCASQVSSAIPFGSGLES